MEIRFLTPGDAGEWLRLRVEALEGDPEAFSSSPDEYRSLGNDAVRRRLWSGQDAFVVGAFDGNRLRGMAGFFRDTGLKTRHKGHVWGVYVTPPARGKQLGRRMMEKLLERGLAIEGVEQILISVTTTQTAAVSLYRSLGFKPFGREPRALKVGGKFIDEEYMVLENSTDDSHQGL